MNSLLKPRKFSEIYGKYSTFFFDLNGVLWYGRHVFKEAFETLNLLHNQGKNIFFITNSSTHTRERYRSVLENNGYKTTVEHVYSASYFAPAYIKWKYPEIEKIYVVGRQGFIEEANNVGLKVVGGVEHDEKSVLHEEDFAKMPVDKDIKGVLVGEDMRFNFYKLGFASVCIQQNGAKLFAANDDPYDYYGERNIPSCGALLKSIETAAQTEGINLGKPNKYALELIIQKYNLDRSKCIMIGDRLNADILLGKNAGVDTCLVLTGETKELRLELELANKNIVHPTHICRNLGFN